MKLTHNERRDNALNELKELGYFGVDYWGSGDIQQAFDEVNAERDEDMEDDYPELTEEQIRIVKVNMEYRLQKEGAADFGDLKDFVENVMTGK